MPYKTLGRIIKEVVGGQSQANTYSNLDTAIKTVMKGPDKNNKDNPPVYDFSPVSDGREMRKDLDIDKISFPVAKNWKINRKQLHIHHSDE